MFVQRWLSRLDIVKQAIRLISIKNSIWMLLLVVHSTVLFFLLFPPDLGQATFCLCRFDWRPSATVVPPLFLRKASTCHNNWEAAAKAANPVAGGNLQPALQALAQTTSCVEVIYSNRRSTERPLMSRCCTGPYCLEVTIRNRERFLIMRFKMLKYQGNVFWVYHRQQNYGCQTKMFWAYHLK